MKTLIITGASKGIGNAIAKEFYKNGYQVFSLSRTKADNLEGINQIACDISDLEGLELVMKSILAKIKTTSPSSITLLNNAGSLGSISRIENIDYQNIIQSININYSAPLILNSLFIKETESWGIERKIRTISSGAANGSYDGWSVYCSTKAAVDRMTSVLGVEQENRPNPVHTIAIYPGVVDTGMQTQIRNSSEEEFSNVERFKAMKVNGDLASPKEVAIKILAIENDAAIENGSVVDVRDY
ncbi:MAG: SDR family NAD(P)-dependent oxidoreductase [Flavobacteriales bacterium]